MATTLDALFEADPEAFRRFAEARGFRFAGSAEPCGAPSLKRQRVDDDADDSASNGGRTTSDKAANALAPSHVTGGAGAMPTTANGASNVPNHAAPQAGEVTTAAAAPLSKREKKQIQGKKPPSERGFDFRRFRFRHVALHFLYLGERYHGFAAQFNRGSSGEHLVDTVESQLFAAMTKACLIEDRDTSGYTRCGRTDAGVSAAGQLVAVWLRSKAKLNNNNQAPKPQAETAEKTEEKKQTKSSDEDEEDGAYKTPVWSRDDGLNNDDGEAFPPPADEIDYCATLNQILPADIRVIGWSDVESAMAMTMAAAAATTTATKLQKEKGKEKGGEEDEVKEKRATTAGPMEVEGEPTTTLPPSSTDTVPAAPAPPFSARFSCTNRCYRYFFVNRGYNFGAMRDACRRLQGLHDFRNFARFDLSNSQNFYRRVESVRIVVLGSEDDRKRAYTPGVAATATATATTTASDGGGALAAASSSNSSTTSGGIVDEDGSQHLASPFLGFLTPSLPLSTEIFPGARSSSFSSSSSSSSSSVPVAKAAGSTENDEKDEDEGEGEGEEEIPIGAVCFFEVIGQAFLWNQVRCMSAVLFHVGAGYEQPSVIDYLLDVKRCDARPGYKLADEMPLCLHHCSFGEEGAKGWAAAEALSLEEARAATASANNSGGGEGEGEQPVVAKPDWAAPDAPFLYSNMTTPSDMALRTACQPLFDRWERLQLEAAMVGSMLQRINTFALSKGLKPWAPDPKKGLCQSKVYQPFEKRPKGLTLAERWHRMGEEEQKRIAALHPYNTARLLNQIAATGTGTGTGAGAGGAEKAGKAGGPAAATAAKKKE